MLFLDGVNSSSLKDKEGDEDLLGVGDLCFLRDFESFVCFLCYKDALKIKHWPS